MTKIEKNNQIINPFGGIIFAINAIKEAGVPEVIDNLLGKRVSQAKYSYCDILINLWSIFLCGGDCAEDINNHLKDYLSSIPGVPVANSDTILGILKSLKTEKEEVVSSTNNTYEINKHDKLNKLNIKILKQLGLLKSGGFKVVIFISLWVIASIAHRTLYLFRPDGDGINKRILLQTYPKKAPCTK